MNAVPRRTIAARGLALMSGRRKGRGSLRVGVVALIASSALLMPTTSQADAEELRFDLRFTTAHPGTSAGAELSISYPDELDGLPKPLRTGAIAFPNGTRFDEGAVPVCRASNDELTLLGTAACDPATRLGGGHLTAATACPPPLDLFTAQIHAFHGPGQVIYAYTVPGTAAPVLFVARDVIEGTTLRSERPLQPPSGCNGPVRPKEGQLTLMRTMQSRSFITTPSRCPARRRWRSELHLVYDDGSVRTATSEMPCIHREGYRSSGKPTKRKRCRQRKSAKRKGCAKKRPRGRSRAWR